MLNAEKYRKEILNNYSKGFSIIDSHIDDCESIACESCLFSHSKNDDGYLTCINRKVKWLLSEYKEPVKLTRLEYEVLKHYYNDSYKYIARDEKCNFESCKDCLFSRKSRNIDEPSCNVAKLKWLVSECKEPVRLTKLEYSILTYILKNTECRYITRNKSRSLCVHSYKPVKDTKYGHWTAVCDKVKSCEVFNNLFLFIKWEDEEPRSIKEILKNCVVVNIKEEQ